MSHDAALSHVNELIREMSFNLDRVIQEVVTRFEQHHAFAEKYAILTPSNLLNNTYEFQFLDHGHDPEMTLLKKISSLKGKDLKVLLLLPHHMTKQKHGWTMVLLKICNSF